MRGLSRPGHQLRRLARIHNSPSILPRIFTLIRHNSHTALNAEAIRAEMIARPPQVHVDDMIPRSSHLLSQALANFLPKDCTERQAPEYVYSDGQPLKQPGFPIVPAGHHTAYFPLRLSDEELCSDGTDPYYCPHDTPCTRRVWAGGSVQNFRGMRLDGKKGICVEWIVDVAVRGPPGAEKIFVDVLREYVTDEDYQRRVDLKTQRLRPNEDVPSLGPGEGGITEMRTLVFLRTPSEEEKAANLKREERIIRTSNKPDHSVSLTPTSGLLSDYSTLTYNAHKIHLDRAYCRETEGHRDLLVHGPLCLNLMLAVLESRLATDEFIVSINYRNLAPLYVDQEMRICVARQKPRASETGTAERNKWDVWIENHRGGLCVKGTAETAKSR